MKTKPPLFQRQRGVAAIRRRAIVLAGAAGLAGLRPAAAAGAATAGSVQLPASVTLQYVVHARYRGLPLQSDATLIWQRDATRYHAEWNVRVPFLGERTQRSDGVITRQGVRPHEYVEQTNKQRSVRFDYERQRVHFSDDRDDEPLEPGAQDRLTVSLQLGALLAADPDRHPVGSTMTLPVVGVRGAETWHWDIRKKGAVTVAGRELASIKLVRRPRRDPDSHIMLWLSPAVHYLPVRMHVEQENGDTVDQQLAALP
ncbi:MAG: DUF3108 domain-containing protein [Candidatus Cloacimonetes bacterium]|nr:DUF3108 domain-containing protein [Candidatus Cloacimonadota bacterium]MCK9517089.1 DUF3108 domain-containing protein [Ottowia sp.]